MKATTKISPEDDILSSEERLEPAFKIAKETFRKTTLTVKDVEKAAKKQRVKTDLK